MKSRIVTMLVCLFVVSLWVVPSAFAEIKFSGDARIEPSFERISDDKTYDLSLGGTRIRITGEAKFENKEMGSFIATKVQPLARLDGTMGVDDAWVQLAKKTLGFKIGRFEAEYLVEKAPTDNIANDDVLVVRTADGGYKVPAPYRADNAWGRKGLDFAFDVKPSSNLLFQLGGIYVSTTDSENKTTTALVPTVTQTPTGPQITATSQTTTTAQTVNVNQYGFRPLVKITVSNFVVKAGFDYVTYQPQDSDANGDRNKVGFGGEVIGTFGKISASIGAASYKLDGKSYVSGASIAEKTTTTIAGKLDIWLGKDFLGFYVANTTEDLKDSKEIYGFGFYSYKLPYDGAYLKFAAGYSSATDESGDKPKAFGGRVRVEYNF